MGRYIDPTTDFGFKRLFGQEDSKEILKGFLFDILELPRPIADLTYIPTEQVPPSPEARLGVYDLYCTDTAGQHFIVEMQKRRQVHFKERFLYYSTFPITRQAERGTTWVFELLPVYCIGILDFTLDRDPRYLRRVQLADTQTGDVFYDKLTFVFVELPKFERPLESLAAAADRWVYLLKHLPELQNIPAELAAEPFTRAFEIAREAALSPEERLQYEASLKIARDNRAVLEALGEEEREKGLKEGQVAGKKEVARTMLGRGLERALILELTGLSEEELAALEG
ncbi:MAG: Rpn family recombination-promoting nuclease/putative transposase [Chloroflexi bacterium]|nr:Rpn family recombination-promoting nuclease/putative transposase [Chloroflexota bacterium]